MKTQPRQLSKRFMNSISIVMLFVQLWACNIETQNTTGGATSPTPQYKPTDSASIINDSLLAVAEREKKALEKLPKSVIDSNSKVIYLTFDDGPLSPTPYLTQIITEKQIKICEFAVGKHAKANKQFMRHLEDMKHNPLIEVHNHSYSHANHKYKQYYSAPATAAKDIMDNEDIIGTFTKIVRMPGRDIWATPNIRRGWTQSGGKTAAILLENGYKIYGWDIEWEHKGGMPKQSPETFVAQVDNLFSRNAMQTPNHLVILAHDEMMIKDKGRQDLRRIIDMLKERGYVFEFMSYYPL
jgi:peptidoglycan-N-acetylglucosamine deacetylase